MAKKVFAGSEGLHHKKAKRAVRKRDGQTWQPDGGSGITPKQKSGYSGNGKK